MWLSKPSSSGVGVGRCGFPTVKRRAPQFGRGVGAWRVCQSGSPVLWSVTLLNSSGQTVPSIHLPSAILRKLFYPRRCSALATALTGGSRETRHALRPHWGHSGPNHWGQDLGLWRIFFWEVPRGAQWSVPAWRDLLYGSKVCEKTQREFFCY